MKRRDFLKQSLAATQAITAMPGEAAAPSETINSRWYQQHRRFAQLGSSRVAYVEAGAGPGALFIHGYPLNGYQWRGALQRLSEQRRCIAPDLMDAGWTETLKSQAISPATQAEMLGKLIDALHLNAVDLVANDSGGLVAQLFVAKYPRRVRTLLLTNCDVDENNPPPQFLPFIELAKAGSLVDQFIAPQLANKGIARSEKGMGGLAYSYPGRLSDETVETYFRPFVENPATKTQMEQYAISMGTNSLCAIREELRHWPGAARMVWGLKDALFGVEWAQWLDRNLPGSRGVRTVKSANLFFPEEMPELIAEEAASLWTAVASK